MASGLLESTGDFLESQLDESCSDLHNNTDQSDDLRYSFHFLVAIYINKIIIDLQKVWLHKYYY